METLPACSVTGSCYQFARIFVDGGAGCVPDAGIVRDPPTWQRSIRQCRGPVVSGRCASANQPCVPAKPPTGAYCIAHAGEMGCPPSYSLRAVYFSGFTDTRACSPCACSDTGAPCDVGWYPNGNCVEGERVATLSKAVCSARPSGAPYLKLARLGRGCSPVGGAQTGAAAPTDPVTLCCRPE
jgi:hypothetical protein